MKAIFNIYKKEMLEIVRDYRTLIFAIVAPTLVIPLIFNFFISFASKQEEKARTRTLKIALINPDVAPSISDLFTNNEDFEIVPNIPEDQIATSIREDVIDLAIIVPEDADEILAAGLPLDLVVSYNNAPITSNRIVERIERPLESFNEKTQAERLEALGVTSIMKRNGILEPSQVTRQGIASKRETIGERIGGMLPYLFILFCFAGGLYPAIDLGAGEKERGTLETLLLSPVPRSYLVLGKFLVVFTCSIVSGVLSVSSIAGWIIIKGSGVSGELGEVIESVKMTDLFMIGTMMVPLAAIFAGVLLSMSIYAKSFKEAQNYSSVMIMMIILPAMSATLPGIVLNMKTAMIPMVNVSLAIKELAKGTIDYSLLGIIWFSTAVLAGLATAFCVYWFQREDVLFRS
jgi:sodium transport system permease protein